MVEITFDNQNMVLVMKGLHKLWTLKSKLKIPLSHIQQARINNGKISRPMGLRLPGTYIPGIITAGTYRFPCQKVFWDVVNKKKAIIIDLKNNSYKQIVVEVEYPEASIRQINEKISVK